MNNFICKACSNGCNLSPEMIEGDRATITGYQCSKGLGYAENYLSKALGKAIKIDNKDAAQALPYSFEEFSTILNFWGITLKDLHPQINILGSPERTHFRIIIEDIDGKFFKLEKIAEHKLRTKVTILETLQFLSEQGLKCIQSYVQSVNNEYMMKHDDGYWQLTPFIKGSPLKRPDYIYDAWRGKALAKFLIGLRKKSQDIPFFSKEDVFDLPKYVYGLIDSMKKHDPQVVSRIEPVVKFLEAEFFPAYKKLPIAFCHGDYHPLNIIWEKDGVNAVIDWEFFGYKAEAYDMAILIGCLGIENPKSLQGDFVVEFIKTLEEARIISDTSWDLLLEFVIALRFAWMSEWLRKKDYEMVELEETYMKLLIKHKDILKETWDNVRSGGFVFSDQS